MNTDTLKEKISELSKLTYNDMPEFSRIDGTLTDEKGAIEYFVEFKTRNHPFGRYPDAVIDANKWRALLDINKMTTVSTLLVYGWSDGHWGYLLPIQVKDVIFSSLTPDENSVSLNRGVEREVVKISLSEFNIRG